jgi:putative oxidoreductase
MRIIIEPVTNDEDKTAMLRIRRQIFEREMSFLSMQLRLSDLDDLFRNLLRRWSIPALRVMLGVVFLWFGTLKLFGISPVQSLVQQVYPFLPLHLFFLLLSFWEIAIGCGLILKRALRLTLVLLCLHLAGTFIALLQAPSLFFFYNNPLCLTTDGEFVIKNLVLVAAGLVVGGFEVKPRSQGIAIHVAHRK